MTVFAYIGTDLWFLITKEYPVAIPTSFFKLEPLFFFYLLLSRRIFWKFYSKYIQLFIICLKTTVWNITSILYFCKTIYKDQTSILSSDILSVRKLYSYELLLRFIDVFKKIACLTICNKKDWFSFEKKKFVPPRGNSYTVEKNRNNIILHNILERFQKPEFK